MLLMKLLNAPVGGAAASVRFGPFPAGVLLTHVSQCSNVALAPGDTYRIGFGGAGGGVVDPLADLSGVVVLSQVLPFRWPLWVPFSSLSFLVVTLSISAGSTSYWQVGAHWLKN